MFYGRIGDFQPGVVDRTEQAVQFTAFIEDSGLGDQLRTEASRQSFFEITDAAEYVSLLIRTNAILTNQSPDDVIAKGINIIVDPNNPEAYVAPAPEDKLRLLRQTYSAGKASGVAALQAITTGFGINAVHPFSDGNGRTARAWHHLLNHDYRSGDPKLFAALQEDGDETYYLNGSTYVQPVNRMVFEKNGTHTPDGVPKLHPVLRDTQKGFAYQDLPHRPYDVAKEPVLQGILIRDPLLSESLPYLLIKQFGSPAARQAYEKVNGQPVFCFDDFLQNSTETDIDNLYRLYQNVKRQYIGELVGTLGFIKNQDTLISIPSAEQGIVNGYWPKMALMLAERALTIDDGYFSASQSS